jgi:hypothetical protein
MKMLVTLCLLTVCGCSGPSNDQKTSGEASSGGSATTVYSMDVANRCAGYGASQAAEFLAVPAAVIEPRFEQVTPTTRGCGFVYRADPTRVVTFSITREDSVDEAKDSFASYRDTVTISSRVQQSATGDKPAEGAYVDILGVGDEAVWSHTNGSLTARRANLTIMVMRPDDRKQQAAVAQKVIAGLH